MDMDTDEVNISTTNATLNNQMDVDSIATRMKSNKRRRNKNFIRILIYTPKVVDLNLP
jgi:hypothetical protein